MMLSVRFLTSILILITGDFQSNIGFYGVNADGNEVENVARYLTPSDPGECVTPSLNPVLDLNGLAYSGSGPWISPSNGTECQLGATSKFVPAQHAFEFDGKQSSNIKCIFEIGASRYPQLSFEVEFYYRENLGSEGLGWIIGHDNAGYDRSVIISDDRFGGMGQGIGRTYNSGLGYPSTGAWHHAIVVYNQNVENGSFVVLDNNKGATTKAENGQGESSFTIGGLMKFKKHGIDGYIRKVALYNKVLSDTDITNMYTDSCVSTGTCDHLNGGGCVVTTPSPSPSPTESPIIGAFGDPHIKTWTGESYDFHGICDLVLFSNPSFDNGNGLDVYIRNKQMKMWSFIETAVIRIGKDKFELTGGKDNDSFLINGIVQKVNNENGAVGNISGYDIKFIQVNDKSRKFVINLDTNNNNKKLEEIVFTTWYSFVSVTVKNPTNDHFNGSLGLMGSYPAGVMVARDGNTVFDDSNEFGKEWQVLSSEPQLFAERGTVGPNDMCSSPSNVEMRQRLEGSAVTLKEAEIACGSVHREMKDLCIFDVLATHDKSSSGAY